MPSFDDLPSAVLYFSVIRAYLDKDMRTLAACKRVNRHMQEVMRPFSFIRAVQVDYTIGLVVCDGVVMGVCFLP